MRKIGTVFEALPNIEFRVKFDDHSEIRCYLAGKMRKYKIAIIINDRVECEVPDHSSIGRIIKRL